MKLSLTVLAAPAPAKRKVTGVAELLVIVPAIYGRAVGPLTLETAKL